MAPACLLSFLIQLGNFKIGVWNRMDFFKNKSTIYPFGKDQLIFKMSILIGLFEKNFIFNMVSNIVMTSLNFRCNIRLQDDHHG